MFTPDQDARRGRAAARVPPGRQDRPRQLDARRASSASCSRPSASTSRRRAGVQSPALWGTRERLAELFPATGRDHRARRAQLRLPLSLARALAGDLPDATTARCSRPSPRSTPPAQARADARSPRADRAVQPLRRRHHGRAERIPRGRRHAPLKSAGNGGCSPRCATVLTPSGSFCPGRAGSSCLRAPAGPRRADRSATRAGLSLPAAIHAIT